LKPDTVSPGKKKKSGTVSNIIGVSVKKFNQNTQKQKMKYPNP